MFALHVALALAPWVPPDSFDVFRHLSEFGARLDPDRCVVDFRSPNFTKGCNVTDDMLRGLVPHLDRLPNLGGLDLRGGDVTAAGLKELKRLRRLPFLDLAQTRVGDEAAEAIAAVPGLESLRLNQTRVTDRALTVLALAPKLRALDLDETRVTAGGLKQLAGRNLSWLVVPTRCQTEAGLRGLLDAAGRMTELDLRDWKLTDAVVPWLAERDNLTELGLDGTGVTTLKPIAKLRRLRLLRACELPQGDDLAKIAADMPHLEVLTLSGTGLTDAGLAELAPLAKLGILDLGRTAVTDEGLKTVARFRRLWALDLDGTTVTSRGLAALEGLPLENLTIPETAHDDEGMRRWLAMIGRPSISGIELDGWRVTDSGLLALSHVPNLTTLTLRRTGITDAGLDRLPDLPRLWMLALDGTALTDAGLPKLTRFKGLREVSLGGTRVTPEGAASLRKLIPGIRVTLAAPK